MKRERKNKNAPNKAKQLAPYYKRKNEQYFATAPTNTRKWLIWGGVIAVLTLVAYSSAFKNGITNWDDKEYVVENQLIKEIDVKSISEIFSTLSYMGNYHPLAIVSLAIDYQFAKDNPKFKNQLNPFPFHFTNILLHLITSLLVFWFVLKLFDNFNMAVIAGLLFGVAALHVESVAWISERKDVLYSAFFVAALVGYLKYLETKKILFFALSLFLFLLSLLSKGQAVSLAVSLVAIDWYKGRKFKDIKVIYEKIPFFLLALGFGILAVIAQKSSDAIISAEAYPFIYRIGFAGYAYMQYIIELTIPVGFSAINPYPDIINKSIPAYYWLYLIPALASLYGFYYAIKTQKKAVAFGIAFFIINIFLLLQFLPVGSAIHADRYAYIPSIGYVILVAALADDLIKKKRQLKMAVFIAIGIFASVQIYATQQRSKVWKDSQSLWNDTVKKSPKAVVAWNNRGSVFDRKAKAFADKFDFETANKYRQQAISDFSEAIKWKPDYVNAYYNRGSSKQSLAKNTKNKALVASSIADFDSALLYDPLFAPAYHNRGMGFDEQGKYEKAIKDFSTAIELNPSDHTYYVNRGVAFGKLNKLKESIADFDMSITLNSQNASVYSNRGFAKVLSKDLNGALEDYNKAIELDPNFHTVFYNRAMLYQRMERYKAAIADLSHVIKINNKNTNAYFFRGENYIKLGNKSNACEDFETLKKLGDKRAIELISKYCN